MDNFPGFTAWSYKHNVSLNCLWCLKRDGNKLSEEMQLNKVHLFPPPFAKRKQCLCRVLAADIQVGCAFSLGLEELGVLLCFCEDADKSGRVT